MFKTIVFFSLICSSLTLYAVENGKASDKFIVNTESSKINWKGSKPAGSHVGLLKVKSGYLSIAGTRPTGGELVVDMTSIVVTDLEGDSKKDLEGHLNSPDFFNTKEHKTAKLKIKDIILGKGGHFDVTGDLTIKGIQKPVIFKAELTIAKGKATAKAKLTFDRTKYNIKYKSKSFFKSLGDKFIFDDVNLEVDLVASKI